MFKYTKVGVTVLSLFITIPIFIFLQFLFSKSISFISNWSTNVSQFQGEVKKEEKVNQELTQKQTEVPEKTMEEQLEAYDWAIAIEKISLIAPIQEGTTVEIMNQAVGHFTTTSLWDGNIGLAAHNRGYPKNYFQEIRKLKKEDKILYKKEGKVRCYFVKLVTVIKDDDWSYLKQTDENCITLITCVENEPNYRRCIQAIEKEENG